MNLAYHVTPKKNVESILAQGLLVKIGENSKNCGEEKEAVFLFLTKDDLENGIVNFLSDCFDEDEELAILSVDITEFEVKDQIGELAIYKNISHNKIKLLEII